MVDINRIENENLVIDQIRQIGALEKKRVQLGQAVGVAPPVDWINAYIHSMYLNSFYRAVSDSWKVFGESVRELQQQATVSYRQDSMESYDLKKEEREAQIRYLEKYCHVTRQAEHLREHMAAGQRV